MFRLHEVKQGKGLRQVGRTRGVLFHRLEVTLTVLNDVGDVPTVQIEGQTTHEEFSSSGNPGISSHRGPGTVPVGTATASCATWFEWWQ